MDDFKPDDFLADNSQDDFQSDDFSPSQNKATALSDYSGIGGRTVYGTNPLETLKNEEAYTGNMASDVLANSPRIAFDSLKSLEPMARQGFAKLTNVIGQPDPSGNLPLDVIKGTPSILGKSIAETSGKVAPGFVSPLSLGMAGTGYAARGISKIPLFNKGIRGTGEAISSGVEKITGIPAENISSVFKKPTSLFTAPTKEAVSKAYKSSEFPGFSKSLEDITEKATGSFGAKVKKGVTALTEYIENAKKDPGSILEGRKALDKQIALLDNQITQAKSGSKAALLDAMKAKQELRYMFNRVLDELTPLLRKADKLASENFSVSPFRQLTLPGKINFMSPEGIARAVPGLPTTIGGTTAALGTVSKGVGQAVENAPVLGATAGAYTENTKGPYGNRVKQDGIIYKWNGQEYVEE